MTPPFLTPGFPWMISFFMGQGLWTLYLVTSKLGDVSISVRVFEIVPRSKLSLGADGDTGNTSKALDALDSRDSLRSSLRCGACVVVRRPPRLALSVRQENKLS